MLYMRRQGFKGTNVIRAIDNNVITIQCFDEDCD